MSTSLVLLMILAFQNCGAPNAKSGKSSGSQNSSCKGTSCPGTAITPGTTPGTTPVINPDPAPVIPEAEDYSSLNQTEIFRFARLLSRNYLFTEQATEIMSAGQTAVYRFEGVGFKLFSTGLTTSSEIYRCYYSSSDQHFLSTSNNCENTGATNEGSLGFAANQPSPGAQDALYRCFDDSDESYISTVYTSECVDNGYTVDGILGYIDFEAADNGVEGIALTSIHRLYNTTSGNHMMSNSQTESIEGYVYEGLSFEISAIDLGFMPPIHKCVRTLENQNVDHFVSLLANCENSGTSEGILGYISLIRIPGMTRPIYRCYNPETGNHFTTETSDCEGATGYTREYLIGYVKD